MSRESSWSVQEESEQKHMGMVLFLLTSYCERHHQSSQLYIARVVWVQTRKPS